MKHDVDLYLVDLFSTGQSWKVFFSETQQTFILYLVVSLVPWFELNTQKWIQHGPYSLWCFPVSWDPSLGIHNTTFYSKGVGVAQSGLSLQRNMKPCLLRDMDPIIQEQSFPVAAF